MIRIFEENNWLAWMTTVLIGWAIYYISSLEFGGGYGGGVELNAIVYHFGAFFFFSLFLMIAVVRGKFKKYFIFAIVLSLIYAGLDELHQYFVPGRFCSLGDVYVDSLGILFAFLFYFVIIKLREINFR